MIAVTISPSGRKGGRRIVLLCPHGRYGAFVTDVGTTEAVAALLPAFRRVTGCACPDPRLELR